MRVRRHSDATVSTAWCSRPESVEADADVERIETQALDQADEQLQSRMGIGLRHSTADELLFGPPGKWSGARCYAVHLAEQATRIGEQATHTIPAHCVPHMRHLKGGRVGVVGLEYEDATELRECCNRRGDRRRTADNSQVQ